MLVTNTQLADDTMLDSTSVLRDCVYKSLLGFGQILWSCCEHTRPNEHTLPKLEEDLKWLCVFQILMTVTSKVTNEFCHMTHATEPRPECSEKVL